ncbi:MAG: hypothetical protein F4139_02185 [Gemmatimonadetes bacterium]|nr:hypothetical protein [Gemmatimonadota bacterium]MYH51738.1 hypothetical protein [Gemmatimonadota bacterium]MYK67683.1 hypothetical protein [Gemmatimonadota bacterium]
MTITLVKVLIGVLALALGVLLGLPGRAGRSGVKAERWKLHGRPRNLTGVHSEEDLQELERTLSRDTALRHRTKQYFTPLGFLWRVVTRGSHRRRTRRYFHTAAPTRKPTGGANRTAAPTRKGNRPRP